MLTVLSGHLTEEEKLVSGYLSQMWVNFASSGNPGLGQAEPWATERPVYTKVSQSVFRTSHLSHLSHLVSDHK